MTLQVKHGKFSFFLWCPNRILCFVVVKQIVKHARDENVTGNIKTGKTQRNTVKELTKSLKKAKKIYGKLELISVKSADGSRVRITL